MDLIASFSLLGEKTSLDIDSTQILSRAQLNNIVSTTGIVHQSRFSRLSFTEASAYLLDYAIKCDLPFPTHLITCTQTPDRLMPSPSLDIINTRNDLSSCKYVDLGTGCTGFVDCSMLSSLFIAVQPESIIYCVTGDISSRIVDPADHATSLVFGDVVNLSVFRQSGECTSAKPSYNFTSYTDSNFKDAIYMGEKYLIMDGLRVLTFVMQSVVPALHAYIQDINESEDLSSFSLVLHQANKFIVGLVNKKIKSEFPCLKVYPFCLEDVGNSSSSTIPLAISRLLDGNQFKTEKVIICGFGVGMTTHIGIVRVNNLISRSFCEESVIDCA